jgi:hypothetical protein
MSWEPLCREGEGEGDFNVLLLLPGSDGRKMEHNQSYEHFNGQNPLDIAVPLRMHSNCCCYCYYEIRTWNFEN